LTGRVLGVTRLLVIGRFPEVELIFHVVRIGRRCRVVLGLVGRGIFERRSLYMRRH
jgi:hypothetical protein